MDERPFYHEGMRRFQDRYDGRRLAEKLDQHRKHYAFWDDERELIQSAPFLFIATAWNDYVDCSVKSGTPGFIKITGPNIIEYPEYDGNSMYRTLGNIAKNPNVGLLFVRFDGRSRRVRINGWAQILDDREVIARHCGARLVIQIECEIYPNCPRYLPDFVKGKGSPHLPQSDRPSPAPEWKGLELFRNDLPHDDPHMHALPARQPDGREK